MSHFKYICQSALFCLNEIIIWFHGNMSVCPCHLSTSPLKFCFPDIMLWWPVKYHKEGTVTCRLILFPVKWYLGHNWRGSLEYKTPSNVIVGWHCWPHQDPKVGRNRVYGMEDEPWTIKVSGFWLCPSPNFPWTAKISEKPLANIVTAVLLFKFCLLNQNTDLKKKKKV